MTQYGQQHTNALCVCGPGFWKADFVCILENKSRLAKLRRYTFLYRWKCYTIQNISHSTDMLGHLDSSESLAQ